jgi:hypothetical protein
MVQQAAPHDGDGFEAAVRMLRKPRDDLAVVHAPAVLALEVLAQVASRERCARPEAVVAGRVVVVVVNTEQERIARLPGKALRRHGDDGVRPGLVLVLLRHRCSSLPFS